MGILFFVNKAIHTYMYVMMMMMIKLGHCLLRDDKNNAHHVTHLRNVRKRL